MSPKSLFRLLVLSSFFLEWGSGVAAILFEDWLPAPLRDWRPVEFADELTTGDLVTLVLAGVYFLAAIGNVVGLLLLWRPSRQIGVGLLIVGYLLVGAWGPYVSFGWESAMSGIACYLEGAALAIAYCWPPITELFDRPKPRSSSDGVPSPALT